MKYLPSQKGFTLIEMTIIIGVVSILAAFAIPSYQSYVSRAHSSACLSEVKGYSNYVFTMLNDQEESSISIVPTINTCQSITDATGWTLQTQQKIIAIAKSPSNARIECDIPNGSPCRILP